jgi:hypothetical protein
MRMKRDTLSGYRPGTEEGAMENVPRGSDGPGCSRFSERRVGT